MTIKAVLLDLDDTLLSFPASGGAFVKAYLGQITALLQAQIPDIQEVLIKAVRKIATNTDPLQRNADIYWEMLAKAAGDAEGVSALRQTFDHFYRETYPQLQALSRPSETAAALITGLGERGYAVVIATNPLYPQTAIEQRLAWAGIDPHDPAIWFVTHAENMHFAKPQPHYYEEIMTHIGFEPYEAIMVGDSWKNDIAPAARTGMHTYWIPNPYDPPGDGIVPDGRGSLEDFAECALERGWLETLLPKEAEPSHIIPRLLGDVGALLGIIQDIPPHFWGQRPDPREWTPLEIVCHLAQSEAELQRQPLEIIAREDNPFLPPPKLPPQPSEWDTTGIDGHQKAREFAQERAITVNFLRGLPADAFTRPARHSIYGPTTLMEMAIFTARHDQLHIQQLCQTIGHCK
jgi:FMN phosphatase YigB (HAD superfamily)